MNAEQRIEEKVGRDPGFRVPEGYFETLYSSMESKLPEREPEALHIKPMTRWERIKPYVYLAAMFAGIWCMMKMFHTMSNTEISLDSPPESVLAALDQDVPTFEEIMPEYDLADYELEKEVSDNFETVTELTDAMDAMGMELEPQYESMNVSSIIDAVEENK